MKRYFYAQAAVLLFILAGCATQWDYPYPTVPDEKAPETKKWYKKGYLRYDAIEENPKYADIFLKIDSEVDAAVKRDPDNGHFGFVHTRNETKRRILYWKYGIDWHPVDAMNPGLMLD